MNKGKLKERIFEAREMALVTLEGDNLKEYREGYLKGLDVVLTILEGMK